MVKYKLNKKCSNKELGIKFKALELHEGCIKLMEELPACIAHHLLFFYMHRCTQPGLLCATVNFCNYWTPFWSMATLKTEVLWTLRTVAKHQSDEPFQTMFPESGNAATKALAKLGLPSKRFPKRLATDGARLPVGWRCEEGVQASWAQKHWGRHCEEVIEALFCVNKFIYFAIKYGNQISLFRNNCLSVWILNCIHWNPQKPHDWLSLVHQCCPSFLVCDLLKQTNSWISIKMYRRF